MRRFCLLVLLAALAAQCALAQGDIDNERKILYRNEWSVGVVVKSTGLELDYRSGKFVNAFKKNLWDCGFSFIKHPQQYRAAHPVFGSWGYGQYCFGKKNFCSEIFFGLGRQRTLFEKFDLGSVEIRYFYFGGVDLALLKPIYYEIYYSSSDIRSEKYKEGHYANQVMGTSEFSKGFSEISAVPGVSCKLGLSVEFGKHDNRLIAMEAGSKLTAFAKKLDIMAQKKNPQFVCSMFVSARFGKVKHGAHYEYLNDYEF